MIKREIPTIGSTAAETLEPFCDDGDRVYSEMLALIALAGLDTPLIADVRERIHADVSQTLDRIAGRFHIMLGLLSLDDSPAFNDMSHHLHRAAILAREGDSLMGGASWDVVPNEGGALHELHTAMHDLCELLSAVRIAEGDNEHKQEGAAQ